MSDLQELDEYATISAPMTLTIQRILPGPIDRCWAYLTEAELRKKWLADGEMQKETGSEFEFIWRNEELSAAPSNRPEGVPEENRMTSTITVFEPPHKLTFTWGEGEVEIELKERGERVLLTLTHHRAPDRSMLLSVSAGWHQHLDTLVKVASGENADPFWENFRPKRAEYEKRIPA